MLTEVEMMAARRRRILAWYVGGYALWMASQIVNNIITDHALTRVIAGIGMIGVVAWLAGSWEMHRFQQYTRTHPRVAAALDDERIQRDRLMAGRDAALIVTLLNGAFVAVLVFQPHLLSGLVVAQWNITTVVVAFIVSFLRRDAADSGEGA